MPFEFDHVFILTAAGAPEGDRLVAFGLTEGSPNVHAGQGTANRRFFFRNAMVELLWVQDHEEAQAGGDLATNLWRRWSDRGRRACPFGLCFRPAGPGGGDPPFASWQYRPAYLPEGASLAVGSNVEIRSEPMLIGVDNVRPDTRPPESHQPLDHPAGFGEITRVELVSPHASVLSPELRAVVDANLAGLRAGTEFGLEIGFDREAQGRTADFRPGLPLVLRW